VLTVHQTMAQINMIFTKLSILYVDSY